MAGVGPPPKSAATRQRRNKVATAARFETDEQPIDIKPELGAHPAGEEWHERTLMFWSDVWDSPMRDEYLRVDMDGLVALTALVDRFWKGAVQLAAEIRLQRALFGLTPMDRRRLQWEVVRAEQAEQRRPSKRSKPKDEPEDDPRSALRAI